MKEKESGGGDDDGGGDSDNETEKTKWWEKKIYEAIFENNLSPTERKPSYEGLYAT